MEHIFRSPSGERKRSRAKRIELNERAVAVYDTPEIRYIQTPPILILCYWSCFIRINAANFSSYDLPRCN